jgi:uncharacterized damage-inducible protein DinB
VPEHDDWAALFSRTYAGDAEGEAFHGPALRRLLDGVTAGTASARPIAAAHTLWEVVLHVAAWREWLCGVLRGAKRPVDGDGWVAVSDASDAAWRAALARLDASQDALLASLVAATPAVLAAERNRLLFVLHHDVYHAGQIGLLRRAT